MKTPSEKLPRKAEALLHAYLVQPTLTTAAASVPMSERAAHNWFKKPAFQAALRAYRRQITDQGVGLLQRNVWNAAATLVRNLTADQASDRNRAAALIIDHATQAVEWGELLDRVEALERRHNIGGNPPLRICK